MARGYGGRTHGLRIAQGGRRHSAGISWPEDTPPKSRAQLSRNTPGLPGHPRIETTAAHCLLPEFQPLLIFLAAFTPFESKPNPDLSNFMAAFQSDPRIAQNDSKE
jgi:hypothetical protein